MSDWHDLQLHCAAKVAALADALRNIPDDLAPSGRASLVALREQIYYGWEKPLARASGARLIFGKYEADGWWSEAAASLVTSGAAERGRRHLERDHVEPVSRVVADLLAAPRSAEETAALLQKRLVTCTVLTDEHRRLGRVRGEGWARYDAAGIRYHLGLTGRVSVWDERNGPEDVKAGVDETAHLDRIQQKERPNVSDVATLLYSGRVTFEEAKALLSEIEMQVTPRMTPEQIAVGYEGYWEDGDPKHLDWLALNGFLTYGQVAELARAMKRPRP